MSTTSNMYAVHVDGRCATFHIQFLFPDQFQQQTNFGVPILMYITNTCYIEIVLTKVFSIIPAYLESKFLFRHSIIILSYLLKIQ